MIRQSKKKKVKVSHDEGTSSSTKTVSTRYMFDHQRRQRQTHNFFSNNCMESVRRDCKSLYALSRLSLSFSLTRDSLVFHGLSIESFYRLFLCVFSCDSGCHRLRQSCVVLCSLTLLTDLLGKVKTDTSVCE